MIRLDAQQTRDALSYESVAREIEAVLEAKRIGKAFAPERLVMPWNDHASILSMPAYDTDLVINKVVTVLRDNRAKGLPIVQGAVTVFRKENGTRMMELDGATVTAFRTAALSLVAMRRCGFHNPCPVTICGIGVQAKAHVEAIDEYFPGSRFLVFGRDKQRTERFAEGLVEQGVDICYEGDLTRAVKVSDAVVTTTNSTLPFLNRTHFGDMERKSKLILAVGAYRTDMAEVTADLVRSARLPIVVDTIEGAMTEAGDLLQAGISEKELVSLANIKCRDEPLQGISLFKSVGNALWDLAACRVVCCR